MSVTVRPASADDVAAIQAIYAHHVRHGLASFEETPPSVEEMARRRADIIAGGFPYLVAVHDGRVVGYAYASAYRARSAYRFSVEDSVYVAADAQRLGAGRALLSTVIATCEALGYRQMVAVIGDSGNISSIALHAALGFTQTGVLTAIGFKFGRWVDSVIMQRPLGPGSTTLPPT